MPRRVLLVDEHLLIRKGIRSILAENGFDVVAEAGTAQQAIDQALRARPSISIISFLLPDLTGAQCVARMLRSGLQCRHVIVAGEESAVIEALQAGARGVVRPDSADELMRAVYACHDNRSYLCPEAADRVINFIARGEADCPVGNLTDRDRELLRLFAAGKGCKDAAQALDLQVSTIRTYRKMLMRKLNVHTGAELIGVAMRHRVIAAA